MSQLRIKCPGCQAVLQVKEELQGKQIACPKCQKRLRLPEATPLQALSDVPEPMNPHASAAGFGIPVSLHSSVSTKCGQSGESWKPRRSRRSSRRPGFWPVLTIRDHRSRTRACRRTNAGIAKNGPKGKRGGREDVASSAGKSSSFRVEFPVITSLAASSRSPKLRFEESLIPDRSLMHDIARDLNTNGRPDEDRNMVTHRIP